MRADGTADFREIGGLVQVKTGTVLARLIPPGPGFPGRDSEGREIPAPPGRPAVLPNGPGTRIAEDGQTLSAACDGILLQKNGILSVSPVLELDKGVDFHTGNVRFDGEVRVKGNVAEGFRVEAAGDILIEGDAESATLISSEGNIRVTGGFFGHGKGTVQAKGEARIGNAMQAEIRCGTLIIEKILQDCRVTAFGIKAAKADSRLIGGHVLCYGDARLGQAGAEGCRTEIVLRDEDEEAMRAEKARLEALEAKEKGAAEDFDRKLRNFKSWIAKGGQVSIPPKVAAEMKAAAEGLTQVRRKLQNLVSEKAMIDAQLAQLGDRKQSFSVAGGIEGNVHLDLLHFRRLLDSRDGGKEFLVTREKGLIDRSAPALE